MRSIALIFFSILIFTTPLRSQTITISGIVIDNETGTPLSGANVIVSDQSAGAVTDPGGFFYIQANLKGQTTLRVTHLGYKPELRSIGNESSNLTIKLVPSPVELGEVIVTSTKSEQLLRNIATPIEIVDESRIINSPFVSVPDALQDKAGVALLRDGIWGTSVSIRGLARANVVTLIDGNRVETATDHSAALSMMDINDVERIEIIKGPASSLYGTGALGGVINILTKGGSFSEAFRIHGSLVSGYSTVNALASGTLTLSAGAQNWFVKASGSMRSAENTMTPLGALTNSQFRDNNTSVELGLSPFVKQELLFSFQQNHGYDIGIPGGKPLFPNTADVRYPLVGRDMYSAEYRINGLSDKLVNASIKYYRQVIRRDVENIPHTVKALSSSQRLNVLSILPSATHTTNGAQLQTHWLFGAAHHVIAGIDAWQRDIISSRQQIQRIDSLNTADSLWYKKTDKIVGELPLPNASYRSIGLYAQDDIKLLDFLGVNIGGRIDQIHVSNDKVYNPLYTITNGVRSDTPAGQALLWNAQSSEDFSWSVNLGVVYTFMENANMTFSVARSFRSPSIEERYQYIDLGSVVRVGAPDLKPEHGYAFDLGVRTWWSDFTLTADGFLNELQDLVAELPGTFEGRSAQVKTNIGKAELYGFDLSMEYSLSKLFSLYGTAAYTRGLDKAGNTSLPQIAPLNGKAGIRALLHPLGTVELSTLLFAAQDRVASGEFTTPGYAVVNIIASTASFMLQSMRCQLFAGIENLLDKSYRNHLATNRGLVTIEPGRNVYFRISIGV
jgi:hemoglobin/transferrin/lactoferrin receptor protein